MKKIILTIFLLFVLCVFLISAFAADKSIQFAWEQVIPVDMGGWEIHYGLATGVYTAIVDIPYSTCDMTTSPPSCQLTKNITMITGGEEAIYFFAIRAYDTSLNYSGFGNEVSSYLDFLAPNAPVTFTAIVQLGQ